MKGRVMQTEHTIPNPMRSEDHIRAEVRLFRDDIEARGGVVVREYRKRNEVFDKRGQKTTTVLVVDWP